MSEITAFARRVCVLSVSTIVFLFPLPAVTSPAVAGGGIVLRPPFNGTYRLTTYFDHYYPTYGSDPDGDVTIYTGETTDDCEPYCYRGHNGIDWGMNTGTDVLAAAGGVVEIAEHDDVHGYGRRIQLDHSNGYKTMYAHLDGWLESGEWVCDFEVSVDDSVQAGTVLGDSGNTGTSSGAHLHFTVYHNGFETDPFGWRGLGQDPLIGYSDETASCLWAGVPGDDISCSDIIVEDDAPDTPYDTWMEWGTWFNSTNGNGYREHHTYSWPYPDSYAYWLPVIPSQGYYQVYAFVPPINSKPRTTNANYLVYGISEQTVYRDQSGSAPRWMSLGTFEFAAGYSTNTWVRLHDFTGEPKRSHWVAADGMKFTASIVHLPDVRNSGGWTSSIVIRNNSGSSAQVAINYYNASGGRVSYQTTTIEANGSKTKTPPDGFYGSAVVVASRDVSVVAEQYRSSTEATAAYPGIRANQAATSLALPLIFYNISSAGHIWRTKIVVHNSSAATAQVSVAFTPNSDPGIGQSITLTHGIPPNGRHDFSHYGEFFGSALLTSTQPVVAMVREYSTDYGFTSAYPALLPSTAPIQLPLLYKDIASQGGDWYTAFQVQNLGTSSAEIRIRYICEHDCCEIGDTWTQDESVDANSALNFDQRYSDQLPEQFFGAAKVESLAHGQTSAQPIAVVVNQRPLSAGGTTNRLGTYVGEGGGKPIYLPRLQKYVGGGTGWSTAVAVRNAGDQSATIALRYYDAAGNQVGATHTDTIASGRMVNIDQRSDTALDGVGTLDGSGVLTSDQPVVVAVNRRHNPPGDNLCSYNGITP